ncbi:MULTISPECIES: alkylmercury lyase [Mycolicibacterium]|uniref:alkylmercury lyase n=1 Tax=Mycolicibacterium TaxID=1866885 RepID=UPI0030B9167D
MKRLPALYAHNRHMRVEIVYFDGCPNWQEAGARVGAAAAGLADVEITYRRVTTDEEAAALPFAGSPTILIDGTDAFDDAVPVTELACRVYQTDTGLMGLPTVTQLNEALRRRQSRS